MDVLNIIDFRRALDQLPVPVHIKNKQGQIIYANRSCKARTRELASRLPLGRKEDQLLTSARTSSADDKKVLTGQRVDAREERESWRSGKQTWASVSKCAVYDAAGKICGVLTHAVDITERRTELQRFRTAVAGSTDGLWYRDLTTREVWFSDRWKKMLGYAPHEFPNKRSALLQHVHPDDRADLEKDIDGYLSDEGPAVYDREFRMLHKDKTYRWIPTRGARKEDSDGSVYFAGSHTDITETKERSEFFSRVLDTVPAAIWVKNRKGEITFANQTMADLAGLPKDEVVGKTDKDLVPDPAEVKRFAKDDRTVLRTRKPLTIKEEPLTDVHRVSHILATLKVPLFSSTSATPNDVHVLGVSTDITELHKARHELEFERQLFSDLMSVVPIGVFFKDRQGRFMRASRELANLVRQKSPSALEGKMDADFFDRKYAEASKQEESSIFAGGDPVVDVLRATRPRGATATQWRLVTKVPITDASGLVVRIAGASRNVTELVEAKILMDSVFNALPHSIWVKDRSGRFLKCNKAYADRKVSEPDQIVGKRDSDFWPPDIAETYRLNDSEIFRSGGPQRKIEEQETPDGIARLDVRKMLLPGPDGKAKRLLCIFEDVTQRLSEQEAEIRNSVGSLGHCFKHWMELLLDQFAFKLLENVPSKTAISIKLVKSTLEYLRQVTQTAISLRALDGGIEKTSFVLSVAVRRAVEAIADPRVQFRTASPRVRLTGSEFHITNAVMELVRNAQRVLTEKSGRVDVVIKARAQTIEIRVADNGPGLPETLAGKEFELFSKGSTDPFHSGLGLPYVKQVCQAHRGAIRTAEQKIGACFIIQLPISERTNAKKSRQ